MAATVARRCAIRGVSGAEMVLTTGDQGDPEVEWDEVDQRDLFYDPRSVRYDFSDARFLGTSRWIDLDKAQSTWPDFAEDLANFVDRGPHSGWERGDERNKVYWVNKPDKQVRIVDHWYAIGEQWHYCIYAGEVMLEYGESPLYDERRRSVHKFELMSYEIDHDNDRYGAYRDLKGPQDEINHRRSKALHQLNARRVIAEAGAVDDVETARREYARADGWVVKNPGREIITEDAQTNQVVQGNLEMLQEAKQEIDTYGPNPGLIGTQVDPASGRAIQLLQAAGIAELGGFILSFKNWKLRVYRKTWNTVQTFWQAPRWIRVTDDDNLAQFIQVNGWQQDPVTGHVQVLNQLAALDVDILIDEGPDSINSMADTLETLVMLGKQGATIPPTVLIELSPLPASTKQRVLMELEKAQQPSPIDQQAIMMKIQQVEAQTREILSKVELNTANAQKALAEAQAAMMGDPGAPVQVDTEADLAKARLDLAKAAEIEQKVVAGVNMPQPEREEPGLFAVNLAKAQESHARARAADAAASASYAQASKLLREARTIDEAPSGRLAKPPPMRPKPAND
ncbi:MAG TPA: hypothetical protein VFS23_06380 [Vicinamibacterales bacterium]|nr:hypothetical protein [Vicinamibacterales bacterium]